MKTLLKLLLLLAIVVYLVFAFTRFARSKDTTRCTQVAMVVTDSAHAGFITKAEVEHALTELDTGNYGMILRSKGIVDGGADGWLEFDYVPGEWEVRARGADVGGKLVVIGSKLDEKAIAALFGC